MKIKVSQATNSQLDWMVAKCEEPIGGYKLWVQDDLDKGILHGCAYSTDWLWGGPIVDKMHRHNRLVISSWGEEVEVEYCDENGDTYVQKGPTQLIAAMRCYIASNLGNEVEVPKELV